MSKKILLSFSSLFVCLSFYLCYEPMAEVSPGFEAIASPSNSFEEAVYFLPSIAMSLLDEVEESRFFIEQ